HQRSVDDAVAANAMVVADHVDPRPFGIPGALGSGDSVAVRSNGWNQLLYSCRNHYESGAARPFGRSPLVVAASLLVLRPSRSLHRGFAGDGHGIGYSLKLLPQTHFQLSNDGLLDGCHCGIEFYRVGSSHVRQRDESLPGLGIHADHT